MDNESTPAEDPLTPLGMMAQSLHELYTTCMASGFNEQQSMQIVCAWVQAAVAKG